MFIWGSWSPHRPASIVDRLSFLVGHHADGSLDVPRVVEVEGHGEGGEHLEVLRAVALLADYRFLFVGGTRVIHARVT